MRRGGVTVKIFAITTVLLVVSALIIYLTLYFMLPSYYKTIKQHRLESGVNELVKAIDGKDAEEAVSLMMQFTQDNNAAFFIRNKAGTVILSSNMLRFASAAVQEDRGWTDFRRALTDPSRYNDLRRAVPGVPAFRPGNVLSEDRQIRIADSNETYTITFESPLQPIGEAKEVIIRFLPYMLIAILLIAIGGAAIYSRLIARPLLGLNKVARRLAKLDFAAAASPLGSNDEIGELSQSLSRLASNLRSTMAELQEANEQLKSDIEREREQEAKRREFVATISHELKTPITAVSGQLEAMIGNVGAFRDRDTYLRQSYKIMRDMDKLVHEILDISKLESRDFLPLMREVDLAEVIRESLDQIGYLAELKELSIECDLLKEAPIMADERLMAKAIANIVGNAVQYSGGGERITVSLREARDLSAARAAGPAEEGGEADRGGSPESDDALRQEKPVGERRDAPLHYRLEVINTGVRLDESKLPRLFEPFYRIEQSRSRTTGGSGLGLYIVSKVMEAHGARYGIENTPEGVKFSVLLPAA